MKALLFGLALSFSFASAAQADVYTGDANSSRGGVTAHGLDWVSGGPTAQNMRLRQKQIALLRLRNDALQQQAQDGGRLTPEHRALLQARLDAIHARWK